MAATTRPVETPSARGPGHVETALAREGEADRQDTALRERVKELSCLYAIAQVSNRPLASLPDVLQAVADLLPTAWQFPDMAAACILLDGVSYRSRGRVAEGPQQLAPLIVRGIRRGSVQIGYPLSSRFQEGETLFLEEEQHLLNEVARQVSLIVDRKQSEDEQARLLATLRHADRLATIGRLASGMAHELNEPLGGILGFAQLLAKTPRLPRQARADIAKIESSALHAREIIRQLMAFARSTPPCKVRVNLNQLIKTSAGIWLPRSEAAGVRLHYALAEDLPAIVADEGQLRQVVINLAVNAIQAMPGGGTLRIETAREGAWIRLAVCDTGVGIAPEVVTRIFDPFFTTKDVDQGTGLGLSVVHGIVAGHQGVIAVESDLSGGTRVTIRLPLTPSSDSTSGGGHAQA